MTTDLRTGATLLRVDQSQKEQTVNEMYAVFGALAVGGAVDHINDPPTSPAQGQTWIVGTSPSGAWAGQANKIAHYLNGWRFYSPHAGHVVTVNNGFGRKYWDGTAWQVSGALGSGASEAYVDDVIAAHEAASDPHPQYTTASELTSALAGKEDSLGNPSSNGQILVSTTSGTRSWVDAPTSDPGTVTSVNGVSPVSGNVTLTASDIASAVLGVALSGLSLASSAAITAVDTILGALGKLQAQINSKLNAVMVVNTQSGTNYSVTLADCANNTIIQMNNGSANTITIPLNATTAIPVGSFFYGFQLGAGQTSFAKGDPSIVFNSESNYVKIGARYTAVMAVKVGTDQWNLIGRLVA